MNTDDKLTPEEIAQKLKESNECMLEALKGAWETMPDDPKIRTEFLLALRRASKINRDIQQLQNDLKSTDLS